MDGSLPLPTPLTQVLVAFTIEFDNEGERRIRHRTTRHGGTRGPWLASLVMWSNCMQFIDDEGLPVRELERRARTRTNLAGMERWGYVSVEPDPADHRPKPPRSSWLVRATDAGRRAQEIWRPLFSIIEERWQDRFGKDEKEKLQETLAVVATLLALLLGVDAMTANVLLVWVNTTSTQ